MAQWIKASERLPGISKSVVIRNINEDGFVANGRFLIETDGSRFISTPSTNGPRWKIEDCEWLEESPDDKDREIERLKGLIEQVFKAAEETYLDISEPRENIEINWQAFKLKHNL